MARFKARELRDGTSLEELRRTLNEIQKEIAADFASALGKSKVSALILDATYQAGFGELARFAPPSGGTRLILPEPNLAQLDARIVAVVEAATAALSVEVVNGLINGASTLTFLAGIGSVEFVLTPTGWYAWSASLIEAQLLADADSASVVYDLASGTLQRAALTGDVTSAQNSNATLFGAIALDHLISYRGEPDDAATGVPSAKPWFNVVKTHVAIHAKFHGYAASALPLDGFALGGSMTWASLTAGVSEQAGGVRCTVPLGASGYAHLGTNPTDVMFDPATLRGFRAIVRLNTANPGDDYDFGIGFGSDLSDVAVGADTGLGTSGIFFRTSGGALWRRVRQAAGSTTGANGAAIVAGNVCVLEAYRTTGTTWEFFVNGVSEGAGSATNIPTAFLNFGWAINDDGGGAGAFTVDVFQVDIFTDSLGDRAS